MFFTRRSQMAKKEEEEEDEPQDQDQDPKPADSDSDTSSDSDNDSYDEAEIEAYLEAFRAENTDERVPDSEMDPEKNFRDIMEALETSEAVKKMREKDDPLFAEEYNPFTFPPDREEWTEADLMEIWAKSDKNIGGTGYDPYWVTPEEWKYVKRALANGKKPPIAPFYLPFRKPIPPVPNNHPDIKGPFGVIEELDRIEEFLKWVSYIFEDGSTYEGTVWDDYAQGKGVYASQDGLARYEGEWLQNEPEGHGVVEVEIPVIEPAPGSKLEEKMRAEGKIIKRDFMSPEDREWLEKDIEDSYLLANGSYEIPFYEKEEWVKYYGRKPEKGRYRYAGQLKHGRAHGCGVFEVNERITYGRFYFGEKFDEDVGCDEETSALHAGIAEVAAAKARMFVNKPDGMVREKRGPYNDPQHAYFYEEEDVWMAPGFINQFYEVPDYWKTYVHEVDQEREMWLNSFYRAPLRIPMPAELEYWWSKEENHRTPEFVLINKEPEPDPEDPSKLIYTEDPLILHTPTGHIINYVEDEKYGVRLFWQPPGEDVDPKKAKFLPLGYDDFFGIDKEEKNIWMRLILAIENACKPWFDKLDKWIEDQKKTGEMKKKAIEKELELIEAEICLEEAIEDMEAILRRREKEEQKKAELGLPDKDDTVSVTKQDEKAPTGEEEDEDEEDEDDMAQSSFGSVEQEKGTDQQRGKPGKSPFSTMAQSSFGSVEQEKGTDQQRGKPGKSPFSTSSLAFASSSLISVVPSKLQQSFSFWNKGGLNLGLVPSPHIDRISDVKTVDSVSFPPMIGQKGRLKAVGKTHEKVKARSCLNGKFLKVCSLSPTPSCSMASANSKRNLKDGRVSGDVWLHVAPERDLDSILSLHSVSSVYNFDNIDSPIFIRISKENCT